MQDLKVIGVEDGALLVVADDGERFRLAIDDLLHSRIRQASPEQGNGRKLSPREIQDQIRSGMSAHDVAAVTGMPVDHVEKYEGPILAEREHIVLSALDVPVNVAFDSGAPSSGVSFGTAIRTRLSAITAINERWASWKDPAAGWVVKLSFTANQIDHDARWSFDPRRRTLSALNTEATTLSQQGDVPTQLIPRLRAVAPNLEQVPDRFDSGAFAPVMASEQPVSRFAPRAQPLHAESNQTADLLDALRRRRGEREPAAYSDDAAQSAHPSTGKIRVIDVPMPEPEPDIVPEPEFDAGFDDQPETARAGGLRATLPQPGVQPASQSKARKGRSAMPSWDDIVFGARPDDNPA